jgi:soluble lytic murein transglycosylase-like protein
MNLPKWIIALLGFFGVTLLVKNVAAETLAPVVVPVVGPAPKWPYEAEIRAAAGRYGVDPGLVAAVIAWETRGRFNADATNPADPSYGLGQVTPYIAVRFGIIASAADYRELYDPGKNTRAVAAFLDYLLNDKKYPLDMAIQMYNEGEPNYWKGCRVIAYYEGVMGYYNKYKAGS